MDKKKVGLVCCSNGQKESSADNVEKLRKTLLELGEEPVFSDYIYEKDSVFSGTAKERAEALMDFYIDEEISDIYDISGGDIANEVLPYLDYKVIAKSNKTFWGYSDLTTIINAIYTKTGRESVLYQIRNLISDCGEQQIARFLTQNDLYNISYQFVQGEQMSGIVVGGNIRCFLKLAGTPYMPDLNGKILLLESRSGGVPQMTTFLSQLQQIGAFDKVNGILLGTFTQMEKEACIPDIITLVKRFVKENIPIAVTREIGHGADSKAIVIGKEYRFDSDMV